MARLGTGGHCEPANFPKAPAPCANPGTPFIIWVRITYEMLNVCFPFPKQWMSYVTADQM